MAAVEAAAAEGEEEGMLKPWIHVETMAKDSDSLAEDTALISFAGVESISEGDTSSSEPATPLTTHRLELSLTHSEAELEPIFSGACWAGTVVSSSETASVGKEG